MRLWAPRTLNEPVRCRFSAFSATVAPTRREISPAETTGVVRTLPRIVSAARSISATPTAFVLGKVAMRIRLQGPARAFYAGTSIEGPPASGGAASDSRR